MPLGHVLNYMVPAAELNLKAATPVSEMKCWMLSISCINLIFKTPMKSLKKRLETKSPAVFYCLSKSAKQSIRKRPFQAFEQKSYLSLKFLPVGIRNQ